MQKIRDLINFIFPVYIITRDDVLMIEDRRPTLSMFLSGVGFIAILGYVGPVVVGDWVGIDLGQKPKELPFFFIGAFLIVILFFVVRGTFREVYVFDKTRDVYTFTRQSVIKKDISEGSLSQFRAVQVERRPNDEGGEKYMVALLMQGLLLGASDTQILREKPPVFNSVAAETRIANSISKFLNIKRQGVVDVGPYSS